MNDRKWRDALPVSTGLPVFQQHDDIVVFARRPVVRRERRRSARATRYPPVHHWWHVRAPTSTVPRSLSRGSSTAEAVSALVPLVAGHGLHLDA